MTIVAPHELAGSLDDLVRHVPGVTALYRSSSSLANVVGSAVSALRSSVIDDPLVSVTESESSLTVAVTIGAESESASDTCRAVHDVISGYLREQGHTASTISVTVAHVAQ